MLALLSCSSSDNGLSDATNRSMVAKVGETIITQDDVSKRVMTIPQEAPDFYSGKQGARFILEEMINAELLYQQAIREGLQKETSFVERVEDFKKLTLANMVLEKALSEIKPVTEKEARAFYDENRSLFSSAEVRVSHILVRAREEAEMIQKSLAGGMGFESAARKWSIDADSALKGGDIGYVRRHEILPELEQTVFAMKKGEISKVIRTGSGYHIIRVTNIRKGNTLPFAKVKAQVISQLNKDREREAFDRYIETLKKSFPVEVYLEKLEDPKRSEQGRKSGK